MKTYIMIFLALIVAKSSICQTTDWVNYTVTSNPYGTFAVSQSDIWACSPGGIVRINQYTENITIYNHVNSQLSFNPNRVLCDSQNKIWFYGSHNIATYEYNNWENVNIIDLTGELDYIKKMVVTIENRIFLLTYYNNSILELINDTTKLIYKSEVPRPDQVFNDFEVENNGNIWIAGKSSVICINETDTIIFSPANSSLPDRYIKNIFLDNSGNLWVHPAIGGDTSLLMYDGYVWEIWEKSVFGGFDIFFSSIDSDLSDNIYLGSFNGIFKYENETWTKIYESADNILIDREDILWCLSYVGQIIKFGNDWKTFILTNNELDGQSNYCIYNSINKVYIGGKNKVSAFDGTIWERLSEVAEVRLLAVANNGSAMALIDNEIKITNDFISWQKLNHVDFPSSKFDYHKIFLSYDNEFWIGTDNGLFKFENNIISKKLNVRINDIDQDENGDIWLATPEGLIKYNDGVLQQYNTINTGLPSNYISHVCVIDHETIWLSAQKMIDNHPYYYVESYLSKFENEIIEIFDTLCCGDYWSAIYFNEGFPIDKIIKGNANDLWINYKRAGLFHLNKGILDRYTHFNSGLADNNINDLLIDEHSNVFILHEKAMSIFNQGGIDFKLNEERLIRKISFYPNPSGGQFYINLGDTEISKLVNVNIFDISGKIIYSNLHKPSSNEVYLDLHNLNQGIYLCHIETEDQLYSGKFLIIE